MSAKGILVLGMHRSGTSAMMGTLWRLGVRMPDDLMRRDKHNELGYWESIRVNAHMENLLRLAQSRWHDWRPLNLANIDREPLEEISTRMCQLVETSGGGANLFAIKDPRICRAVPLWLDIMTKCRRQPVAILMTRHPFEVARSLSARDGMPFDKGLLLWLRHMLDAERDTRGICRVFVQYDDLLNDWRKTVQLIHEGLAIDLPTAVGDLADEVEDFLRPDLRHWTTERQDVSNIFGATWFLETWDLLCQCCLDQGRRDDHFDRIVVDVEKGTRPFQHYFGLIEASFEASQRAVLQSTAALDRAKWMLGGAVIASGANIATAAESMANAYVEKLVILEHRLEQLEAALSQRGGGNTPVRP